MEVALQDLAVAAGRPDETEQHPDRRRLPGAVRSDETAHRSGRNGEIQAVDDSSIAEVLGQSGGNDGATSDVW